MTYEYCVIGNGLIGAAVALELADKSDSVCVLGAAYGDQGRYYSSHEDDSRIARCWHSDLYWQELAERNAIRLRALSESSGLRIFRRTPVFYNFPSRHQPANAGAIRRTSGETANAGRFEYQDVYGGVIDPKLYISALNQEAQKKKATVVHCVAHDTRWKNGTAIIATTAGDFQARHVVDAKGIFSRSDAERSGLTVVGKFLLYVASHHEEPAEPFCFVDSRNSTAAFEDMYGIVDYKTADGHVISKFGFSEREPIHLSTAEDIAAWFQTGYLTHPLMQNALESLQRYFRRKISHTYTRPCAFVTTANKRPVMLMDERHCVITGCNGMAAKCCQALAEQFVRTWK